MMPQLILKATQGSLSGDEFVFSGKTQCVVGRARGCSLCIPGVDQTVSRHHCRLDIDAPMAWVEDLGSLNGTFVNGESIGQRGLGYADDEGAAEKAPPRLLADGDELRLGGTVFTVIIDEVPLALAEGELMEEECMAVA